MTVQDSLKKGLLVTLITGAILAPVLTHAQGKSKVLATVGGVEITQEDLDARISAYPPQYAQALQKKENQGRILDQLIDEQVLLLSAKKQKINESKDFKKQAQNAQNQIMSGLLIASVEKNVSVTDKEISDYFTANPAQFQELELRHVRHILVKTEDEAKAVQNQLKGGADFAQLAKDKSTDPSAATNSGDLGWVGKGQLVPEFEKVAFSLTKGTLSDPVKTQFGYHIIKLDDINVRPKFEFKDVKDQIKEALVEDKKRKLLNDFLTKAKKDIKIKRDTAAN